MYIGELSTRELISIGLMIFFALAAMFFFGYKYAYDVAITYANEQIEERINEAREYLNIIDPDYILGNIEIPDFGGQNEEWNNKPIT